MEINCGKLQKNLNTFSHKNRHKMTFSLVFQLKIRKLHLSHYLRNKARSPTLSFAFAIYMSRQVTYLKKIRNLNTLT